MKLYCGIDPDTKNTAIAIITEDGRLYDWAIVKTPSKVKGEEALPYLAKAFKSVALPYCAVCCVEGQRIYRNSQAAPNTIITLANAAGVCLSWAVDNADKVCLAAPQEWKGTVPKPIHQARILRKAGWGAKKKSGYSVPILQDSQIDGPIGKIKDSEWKHLVDAIGLAHFARDRVI